MPFPWYAANRIRGEILEGLRRRNFQHLSTFQLSEDAESTAELQMDSSIEADLDREQIIWRMRRAIEDLDPKTRAILQLRFCCDRPWKQIAKLVGLSQEGVFKRRRAAFARLRKSPVTRELKDYLMKRASKEAIRMEDARRSAVVDELGVIRARQAKRKADLETDQKADAEREAELEKEMLSWTNDWNPAESQTFYGRLYQAKITARKLQRSISLRQVFDALGVDQFVARVLNFCALTLKNAEVILTKEEQAKLISESPSGARDIKVTPILQESTKKAA